MALRRVDRDGEGGDKQGEARKQRKVMTSNGNDESGDDLRGRRKAERSDEMQGQ